MAEPSKLLRVRLLCGVASNGCRRRRRRINSRQTTTQEETGQNVDLLLTWQELRESYSTAAVMMVQRGEETDSTEQQYTHNNMKMLQVQILLLWIGIFCLMPHR